MVPLASGEPRLVARWAEICTKAQRQEDEWIEQLRSKGVKAAHPDDGWVDRVNNTIHFAYPQFDDGAGAGDKIALGWPDEYRIVTIIGEANGLILERWRFK